MVRTDIQFIVRSLLLHFTRCLWHLSSSVTWRICNLTHQGAARVGPVVLRLVRATSCSMFMFNVCAAVD